MRVHIYGEQGIRHRLIHVGIKRIVLLPQESGLQSVQHKTKHGNTLPPPTSPRGGLCPFRQPPTSENTQSLPLTILHKPSTLTHIPMAQNFDGMGPARRLQPSKYLNGRCLSQHSEGGLGSISTTLASEHLQSLPPYSRNLAR